MPTASCPWRMVLLAAGLMLAAPAQAGFQSDYIAGLAALDHGDYGQAEKYLKRALEAQPNPVHRISIGGNPQPYLPHHFLGLAAYHLGKCAVARREWDSDINRHMLGKLYTLRREERQLLDKCQEKPQAVQQATVSPAPVTPPVPAAPATEITSTSKVAKPPPRGPVPVKPPARLIRAYEDFVAGRYADTSRIDPGAFSDPRARYQAFLLRAAARFSLVRIGSSGGMLDDARSDARAARAIDRSDPDPQVFSPSFRAFYNSQR